MGEGSTDLWNVVPYGGRGHSANRFHNGGGDHQNVQEESKDWLAFTNRLAR